MGYFPNGISGEMYQEQYCHRCINEDAKAERWCWIFNEHLLHNYEECNKADSYLNKLIPRDGIHNGQCVMFVERQPEVQDDLPPASTAACIKTLEQLKAYQKQK